MAKKLYGSEIDVRGKSDPTTTCYLDLNFPTLLFMAVKYDDKIEECLLANANTGGENVHRGLVLGALVGAACGSEAIPEKLKTGLVFHDEIKKEIDAFIAKNVETA